MPLPGAPHNTHKIFLFIFILTFLSNINTFSQNKKFAAEEDKLAELYSTMVSFYNENPDSLEFYSKKFERELKRFIKSNPGTLKYNFKQLSGDNTLQIKTSSDGNFRIYNWDTENSGPVHFYRSIYQWKNNGRVFTDITDNVKDDRERDGGDLCNNLHSVMIDNKAYYLAIKVSVGSSRSYGETISAYRIEGEHLIDTVRVFKTKTEKLNSINVNIDRYYAVDDYNQNEGISYDAQQKIVSIPLVNDKGALTNKYLLYLLKGRYFEYIGTSAPASQEHVLFEETRTKFQNVVTSTCDTIDTHLNDRLTDKRIAFLNKDFSTTLFSNKSSVAYWYCNSYGNQGINFEIVSIIFRTDNDRDAALEKINSAGRKNFIVKAPVMFKVKTFENGLLIAYTQTAKSDRLMPFWDNLWE